MSYRNPAIIKDTSGELYGQAAANVGRSLARGVEMAGSRREQQRKQADADRKRTQQIGYGIQSKAYESRNKVYTELLKKEPGLAEQFKEQTEALLMGNDEIGMGAIEARTILATGQNLDMEEKQRLQEVINRYEVFQSGLQGNSGKIQAEVQLYQSTSPGEFDDKYRWAGSNEFERTTSQLAASALANEEIPGARYEKKLYTPTSNGEQVVGIKIYVDPNNPSNKGKYDNEEVYPRNENGEIELEWKKDLNKWDEGLLEEIVASPDSISMFKNAGITDKNNGWSENQFLDLKGKSRPIKGLNGKDMTVISRDLNVPGWLDNDVLQDEIKSKAEGFQDMGDSDLASFMSVKMKVGGFNITEFRKQTREEQLFQIEKELNEDFIIQKTGGLGKREASSDEPGAVIDPLNPIKEVDGEEVENFVIYSQDSKPTITQTSSNESNNESNNKNPSFVSAKYKINQLVENGITNKDSSESKKFFIGKKIAGKTVSDVEIDQQTGNITLKYTDGGSKIRSLGGFIDINLNSRNDFISLMEQIIARGGDPTQKEILEIRAMEEIIKQLKFPGDDSIGKFVRTDEDVRPPLVPINNKKK